MYGRRHRTIGLTLIETTLVVATIALLVGFAVPAVKALIHSFHTEGGARSMVSAALNSARTMAVSKQRYVGVRFQKLCTSDDPLDPLKGLMEAPQYMIFIMHDPADPPNGTGLVIGFRAIPGLEPIKLPETMGVMMLSNPWSGGTAGGIAFALAVGDLADQLSDATTFSIVFSPSGRLVVHDVRVRNRDGKYQPSNDLGSTKVSRDDVFNSVENICRRGQGRFIQDDYCPRKNKYPDGADLALGEEPSVTNFVIYDRATLRAASAGRGLRDTTEYLVRLDTEERLYVSSYTGSLISLK